MPITTPGIACVQSRRWRRGPDLCAGSRDERQESHNASQELLGVGERQRAVQDAGRVGLHGVPRRRRTARRLEGLAECQQATQEAQSSVGLLHRV